MENIAELGAKSKIKEQQMVDTLIMYYQTKNLPIQSRDEKEVAFFFCSCRDTQTYKIKD